MLKWIGQHIVSLIARFRSDVYLERLEEQTQDHVVGIDSDGKLYKQDKATKTSIGLGSVDNLSEAELTTNILATADKTSVGLDNVDNTSDANKPISTAVQAALNDKAPTASPTFTGTVSGITASMVGLSNVEDKSSATIRGEIVSADIPNNAADTSGNAATATALATARNIAGVAFDGTGDISLNNNAITNGAGYTTNTGDITRVKIQTDDSLEREASSGNADFVLQGGEGIDTSQGSGGEIVISGELASTSNKGVAAFDNDYFIVTSGNVSIKDGGINLEDVGGAVTGTLPVSKGGTGNTSGQAATVATISGLAPDTATTAAAQPNITSLGTLTGLDVASSVTADTFVSIQGIDTGNPNAATDELRVSGYGILGNRASGVYITNESTSGKLFFGVGDKHALATRMTILANGNVGINTTSPGSHLHVNGNIRVNGSGDSIQSNNWAPIANANSEIRSNNGYDLILNATTGDNVGIATSNPGERLDVSGNIKLSGHIELGHASDTTIARSAAGKATIEGREITTNGNSGTNFISWSTNGFVQTPSVDKLHFGNSLYGNYHFNWQSTTIARTSGSINKNTVNSGWLIPVDLAKVEVYANVRVNAANQDIVVRAFKTASNLTDSTAVTYLGSEATVTGITQASFQDVGPITDIGSVSKGEMLYVGVGCTNGSPQMRFNITVLGYIA